MKDLLTGLRGSQIRALVPKPLRRLGYRLFKDRLDRAAWQAEYDAVLSGARPVPPRSLVRLGIVKDIMLKHSYYEAACLELGVPYKLVDVTGADWMESVRGSGCAGFLVRPFTLTTIGKAMYDERVKVMAEDMGLYVFPPWRDLWLYESKRRAADWLKAHDVPHPPTHVFFEKEEALDFTARALFPLVFKAELSTDALGVRIVRRRGEAERLVRRCFGRGYLVPRHDPRDRNRGHIIFQDYVPDAKEWRVVRIGRSWFGHRKGMAGGFHSGSKLIEFDAPPVGLLEFARGVMDKGGFLNMALDILEDGDGRYLVIELHSYFGCNSPHVMRVDGKPGRFVRDERSGEWRFEPGDFNRNNSCNLRVELVLELLAKDVKQREKS